MLASSIQLAAVDGTEMDLGLHALGFPKTLQREVR